MPVAEAHGPALGGVNPCEAAGVVAQAIGAQPHFSGSGDRVDLDLAAEVRAVFEGDVEVAATKEAAVIGVLRAVVILGAVVEVVLVREVGVVFDVLARLGNVFLIDARVAAGCNVDDRAATHPDRALIPVFFQGGCGGSRAGQEGGGKRDSRKGVPRLAAAQGHHRVDFMTVGVAPRIDDTMQWLRIDPSVSHHECLEVKAQILQTGAQLGTADIERGGAQRGVDEVPHRRGPQPGPRSNMWPPSQ